MARVIEKHREVPKGPATPDDAAPWPPLNVRTIERQHDHERARQPADDADEGPAAHTGAGIGFIKQSE
jgi:hypothetical protein